MPSNVSTHRHLLTFLLLPLLISGIQGALTPLASSQEKFDDSKAPQQSKHAPVPPLRLKETEAPSVLIPPLNLEKTPNRLMNLYHLSPRQRSSLGDLFEQSPKSKQQDAISRPIGAFSTSDHAPLTSPPKRRGIINKLKKTQSFNDRGSKNDASIVDFNRTSKKSHTPRGDKSTHKNELDIITHPMSHLSLESEVLPQRQRKGWMHRAGHFMRNPHISYEKHEVTEDVPDTHTTTPPHIVQKEFKRVKGIP